MERDGTDRQRGSVVISADGLVDRIADPVEPPRTSAAPEQRAEIRR